MIELLKRIPYDKDKPQGYYPYIAKSIGIGGMVRAEEMAHKCFGLSIDNGIFTVISGYGPYGQPQLMFFNSEYYTIELINHTND